MPASGPEFVHRENSHEDKNLGDVVRFNHVDGTCEVATDGTGNSTVGVSGPLHDDENFSDVGRFHHDGGTGEGATAGTGNSTVGVLGPLAFVTGEAGAVVVGYHG